MADESLYYLARIEALERDTAILAISRRRVEKELDAATDEIAMLKSENAILKSKIEAVA